MKKNKIKTLIFILILMIISSNVIFANGIQSLKLYTGTLNLLRDATTALMVMFPVVCGLCILIFQLKKGTADIQEQPMWSKRTKIAIITLIVGFSASSIVNLVTFYYTGQ